MIVGASYYKMELKNGLKLPEELVILKDHQ